MNQTNLKEEIGAIIYDANIYKNKVTTGQLNAIIDDIMKEIEKRIDENIISGIDKEHYEGFLVQDDVMIDFNRGYIYALTQIKELLK